MTPRASGIKHQSHHAHTARYLENVEAPKKKNITTPNNLSTI